MYNVRSFFILLGMALFAAVFVAGCSSDEGDAEDIASGASADASGASAAAADTGTAAQGPIRRSFHRARDRPQHDIYQSRVQ